MCHKHVLLFSNPVWGGANTVPTTIVRNITALSSQLAYEARLSNNLTVLTTTNADPNHGVISGLLYVPDIDHMASCNAEQYDFIPRNVTRQNNLPPTNYNLIALAPWFSSECTQAYLASARFDPIRAFVFYKPNNSSNKPQDVDSVVWDLGDDGAWTRQNRYPIFAIPGIDGHEMMTQLGLYSGGINDIPHADDINDLYGPHPRDYVRIWTELTMEAHDNSPAIWSFVLIILGALLGIFGVTSLFMHFVQRRRRKSLERRVKSGEVDLEAMGVKRITVPVAHVTAFPVFTYNSEPDILSTPPTPGSPGAVISPQSVRSSRKSRRRDSRSVIAESIRPSSIRSKRSNLTGSGDNTATNHQPDCQICLDRFEHRVTIIRQLPCGHIFHPACIDEFLCQNSSLCPLCKHCMLPRDYSPKITNGMVRRERALRRLRERVNLDDIYFDSAETKSLSWKDRLFHPGSTKQSDSDVSLKPLSQNSGDKIRRPATTSTSEPPTSESDNGLAITSEPRDPANSNQTPPPSKPPKQRRTKPRPLRLLPTQPEDSELQTSPSAGRKSPSSFARQRMREMAARNAPFDDPDQQYPKWRRAFAKVFPGFS
ncbi:hypothetical protein S7711_00962 [Stachybotrys chartarum IBT 7711]|uniref:RING-type domain-containing protein n=1 Tax=Stachybotrys chartarum (strain CBS 109288 / IBT 7711) TaxID=1280523 RepID=A0A084B0R1_STACB|nr:hypothetical protein S7711_00962 [Stachybotrys chartarum IBT 7711]KFA51031.1 hypothetical protein S40293_07934 [Stachybotrys chartarum IBT 40293]KFA78665.1 hypothetical protein S40288_06950 [Stachybotrys chartarum IBT 40288]